MFVKHLCIRQYFVCVFESIQQHLWFGGVVFFFEEGSDFAVRLHQGTKVEWGTGNVHTNISIGTNTKIPMFFSAYICNI